MEGRDASGARLETAVLGGGCFWCLEAVYEDMDGVRDVVSGYAGGHDPRPTYEHVCSGRTGHAEVVQVTFDPSVVTYRELLDVFFKIHDPTSLNRQGADVGTQYRSIILTKGDAQRRIAEAAVREENASEHWERDLVTEIVPLETFFPAEEYHQDYFRRNPGQGYCQAVVAPKLRKFREAFPDKRR
ncbi:peptide-methionine (S)-S-oxide reductase MsrA [bacterium]|nr:peptide-methionine (S)-S-oxide reductase MsrA [bacterium]